MAVAPTRRSKIVVLAVVATLALFASSCAFDEMVEGRIGPLISSDDEIDVLDWVSTADDERPTDCWTPLTSAPKIVDGELPSITTRLLARVDQPIGVIHRPGTRRPYVLGRRGDVRIVGSDAGTESVLDVSDLIVVNDEEGLLGGAFSPDGKHLYLYLVSRGVSRLVEFPVLDATTIVTGRARTVLEFEQPFTNHNGGQLLFGPDCRLYMFTGDGKFDYTGSDPERAALDPSSPLGKVLRIDPRPTDGSGFSAPFDNPFVGVDGAFDAVWSMGLRNPWRASFDLATGDLWIGDVGEEVWEEINVAWVDEGGGRGRSFGWSAWEGTERRNEDQPAEGHDEPFHVYGRDEGCSISAGARYRGSVIPELVGWFVYADFCSGEVRALEVSDDRDPGREVVLVEVSRPVEVSAMPDGELVVVSLDGDIVVLIPMS